MLQRNTALRLHLENFIQ